MALVLFEIDGRGVATITLNRPDRLNAINMEMRDLLWEYLGACRDIPEVGVIVFRGEGRCFRPGADIPSSARPWWSPHGGRGGPPSGDLGPPSSNTGV